jgi:hypothetical protein
MSNFFVGTLVGFFLGALVMFVGIGIICLHLAKREEQSARAGPRNARETRDDYEALPYSPTQGSSISSVPGPVRTGGLHD